MIIIWLYIALNRTPNIDCYWVGAVPKGYFGVFCFSELRASQISFVHGTVRDAELTHSAHPVQLGVAECKVSACGSGWDIRHVLQHESSEIGDPFFGPS